MVKESMTEEEYEEAMLRNIDDQFVSKINKVVLKNIFNFSVY